MWKKEICICVLLRSRREFDGFSPMGTSFLHSGRIEEADRTQ